MSIPHKNWHSRGYLPHCDTPGLFQGITFRLADALPSGVLQRMEQEDTADAAKRQRVEQFLNAGHGACLLRDPVCARLVEKALLYGNGERYRLLAWVVMPNHVHVLIEQTEGWPLDKVVAGWKSCTAKQINRYLGKCGVVWMRDYHDRYVRDDTHLQAVIEYIHDNPVKAGLAAHAKDWSYSSAAKR